MILLSFPCYRWQTWGTEFKGLSQGYTARGGEALILNFCWLQSLHSWLPHYLDSKGLCKMLPTGEVKRPRINHQIWQCELISKGSFGGIWEWKPEESKFKHSTYWEFPGGPVVKTSLTMDQTIAIPWPWKLVCCYQMDSTIILFWLSKTMLSSRHNTEDYEKKRKIAWET